MDWDVMGLWKRYISNHGGLTILMTIGGFFILSSIWRLVDLTLRGRPLLESLPSYSLIALLGTVLLVSSYRVSRSTIDSELTPRMIAWSFFGATIIAAILAVIELTSPTGLSRPIFAMLLGIALGCCGGFAIGVNEARAITRANEAERRQLELESVVAKLERQNDRLDEFASLVSHDLRNPLNVAQGRLELVRADADNENMEEIARSLERMDSLIEDMNALAREGNAVEETDEVELAPVVRESWEFVQPTQATLQLSANCLLSADRSRLLQVVENLIRNAIEHNDEQVTITVGLVPSLNGFYIEDDGSGIPQGEQQNIFEGGYSSDSDGTGYGLAIVQQIIQAHGWEISTSESESGGARFEITTESDLKTPF